PLVVDLLAEVEVRGDGVLEEMDQEVAPEDEDRRAVREPRALGDHAEEDRRQHEARAERDRVAKKTVVPAAERHHRPAEEVGRRGEGDARDTEAGGDLRHRVALARLPGRMLALATSFGRRIETRPAVPLRGPVTAVASGPAVRRRLALRALNGLGGLLRGVGVPGVPARGGARGGGAP